MVTCVRIYICLAVFFGMGKMNEPSLCLFEVSKLKRRLQGDGIFDKLRGKGRLLNSYETVDAELQGSSLPCILKVP